MQNPFADEMDIMPEPPPLEDNSAPKYQFPSAVGYETVPADFKPTPDRPVPALRCSHERADGSRCKKFGIKGTGFNGMPSMCLRHGGSLPPVRAKADAIVLSARMQLIESVPMALEGLIDLSENANAEAIRLKAIESILDRAGLKTPVEMQIEISDNRSPSEDIFKKLAIMRERETPKEDIVDAEDLTDEGEKQPDVPFHVNTET